MKRITVFGATGMLGKPVTQELIKSGFNVNALVRDVEKAKNIFPVNVTFIKGDLQDLDAIREAMKQADGVYISIANTYKDQEDNFNAEMGGLDNILSAAKELKIKQVVLLSSFLARNYKRDWWIYKSKRSSIDRVKNAGIPYTIFYAPNFMENIHNGMIRKNKIAVLKHQENHQSYWIAAGDFGKLVANAFNSVNALNKEYPVQGPQAFTTLEVAEVFAKNYSKVNLSISQTPFKVLKFLGLFSPYIKFMSKHAEVNSQNEETFESKNTWDELGIPKTTIAMFAKQS
jgi:uncharacterized protein YbjT (DUF2867 family)